ncbi:DNA methyltransferase [Candidatus Halobeggiatoa sp. HSG11]|nr:DNA methyltransferase [Candidatus Halobeggiatoa sp. HSG11]
MKTHNNFKNLAEIPIKYEWSFADKTIKHTAYITHGVYTYPAKFIPQLAAKIISEYSKENDIVIDPFMGSGTTVVEAMVNNRIGIGTDINEIAVLLAKVKSTPINCELLESEYSNLISGLQYKLNTCFTKELAIAKKHINLPDRVDYWFKPHIKDKLIIILHNILKVKNTDIKDFFLIIFAQILKSCSIWLQKSVKPTRDLTKKEIDPLAKFEWQAKKVLKKFNDFNSIISHQTNIEKYRTVQNSDARDLPCGARKATLIVTSPPYVTSYEYADLHQLPSLWFGFLEELAVFRKKFIGSSSRERNKIKLKSKIAENIVAELGSNKKSREVENYFADMLESFIEMKRVLKKGGKAAIVIGNTKLKGVEILNAEVFKEQFENIGFKTHDIIHREIPSKMLPSTRDSKNGKFTKTTNDKKSLVYPTEYILIMEKK